MDSKDRTGAIFGLAQHSLRPCGAKLEHWTHWTNELASLLTVGYAVAFAAVAWSTFARRDVT